MVLCSKYTCNVKRLKGDKVSYHVFPSNKDLCRKWTEFCQQPPRVLEIPSDKSKGTTLKNTAWTPSSGSKLCGRHFTPADYSNHLFNRLNPDAIPSIHGTHFRETWEATGLGLAASSRVRYSMESSIQVRSLFIICLYYIVTE